MSRSSSPWATPTSTAGRRLLDAEPATLDAVPVPADLAAMASAAWSTPGAAAPSGPGRLGLAGGGGPRPARASRVALVGPRVPIDREDPGRSRPWPSRSRGVVAATTAGPAARPVAPAPTVGREPTSSPRAAARCRVHRRRPVAAVAVAVLALGMTAGAPASRPERVAAGRSMAAVGAMAQGAELGTTLGRAGAAAGGATKAGGDHGSALAVLLAPTVDVRAALAPAPTGALTRLGGVLAAAG